MDTTTLTDIDARLAADEARENKIIAALQEEAEARVRAGESRAEVARSLGIPLWKLAEWARRGGWRRKDLKAVRDAKMGEEALKLFAELSVEENKKREEQAREMRELLQASKAELEAIAPDGLRPSALGGGPVPAHKFAWAMAESLLRQGRLEEADRAVRLAARFAEAEQAAVVHEETKLREERERLTKWWAEQQSAYHRLHSLVDVAFTDMEAAEELARSRSAADCCPTCDRRMDFWPEEVDRPGEDESDGDSGNDDGDGGDDDDDDDFHAGSGGDDSDIGNRDDDDFGAGSNDDDFHTGSGDDDFGAKAEGDSWLNRMERGLKEPSG